VELKEGCKREIQKELNSPKTRGKEKSDSIIREIETKKVNQAKRTRI